MTREVYVKSENIQ